METINVLGICQTIWYILMAIGIFLLVFNLSNLITSISEYFHAKKEDLLKPEPRPDCSIDDIINMNNFILDAISTVIHLEVYSKVRALRDLNTSYNILNLDKDIDEISTNVFNAFKEDMFKNEVSLFTPEYLFSYIAKTTTNVLLETTQKLNDEVRNIDSQ